MANRADIRQVTLSNNQYTSIIKGLPNAIALDYHFQKDLLFWTDVSADVIKMSFLNGTNVKDVIKWGLESPGGLALDWVHELLFWTDSSTRRVEVSTFDGKLRGVVAANDLDKPRAIVVHPGHGYVAHLSSLKSFLNLNLILIPPDLSFGANGAKMQRSNELTWTVLIEKS